MIEVANLSKRYGDLLAVDDLSFEVREGEVYALLGENGAGKSTTVEIMEGYRSATSGSVEVLGSTRRTPSRDFRNRVGIVLQSSGVEDEFTVREVIELYGGCYSARRGVDELVGWSGSTRRSTTGSGRCRAASSGGSIWRSASSATPRCFSSTSRRPGSTPRRGGSRGTSSSGSATTGRRSC